MKAFLIAIVWLVSLWSCYWLAFGHGLAEGQRGLFAETYAVTDAELLILKHNDDAALREALVDNIAIRLRTLHSYESIGPYDWLQELPSSFVSFPRMAISLLNAPARTVPVSRLDDELKAVQAPRDPKSGEQ